MDERLDFDINDALKHYLSDPLSILTPEAPSELVDCENDPEAFIPALINSHLNPVVDAVAENPEAVTRRLNFDTLQFLLKCAPTVPEVEVYGMAFSPPPSSPSRSQTPEGNPSQGRSRQKRRKGNKATDVARRRSSIAFLPVESSYTRLASDQCALFVACRSASILPPSTLSKILDLLVSSLSAESELANADIEAEEQDSIAHHKQLLEIYGFLLQWTIAAVETKATEKQASATVARGRKGAGKGKSGKDANWDASAQLTNAMEVMSKVMKLKLVRIFVTTSERDTFISLFTRPVYLILENEARLKNMNVKMHAFKVLCIAVKHHGHAFGK
jgi:condensin complex subunit 1